MPPRGLHRLRPVGVVAALICLVGCGPGADEAVPTPVATTAAPHRAPARLVDHRGSLSPADRDLATGVARREERKVTGTFVGATAFATRGTPFDRDSACDVDRRFVTIRLVWESDANFVHSHAPGAPPDGPRKDLLITVDPTTGDVCETGAGYRRVGANARETLLYGEWPDPADG